MIRLALLIAWLSVQGCTQWYYELGTPFQEQHERTPDDGAALGEVLAVLGPPQRISALDKGYVLAWEHWQVSENALGLSLGALGADFLSLDWGRSRVEGEFLMLTFNRHHRLIDRTYSQWNNDAGGGAALQPFIGLASITDIDDLVARMPHHDWGAAWLKRLPESLNTPSRPDMGQSGIQQRGTPVGIGQRTLEMD